MGGENMEDIGTEKMAVASNETGPTTKFGTALVGFADRMDALASKETNLTHRQMWLALGTEAVIGGLVIAGAKSGYEGTPVHALYQLLEKIEHAKTAAGTASSVTMEGGRILHLTFGGWTEMVTSSDGEITLGQFTRDLLEGARGISDSSGKPLFQLGGESLETLAEKFEQLRAFEGKRDQLRNLFLLAGAGSAIVAAIQVKAGGKVRVSSTIMPAIAGVVRGIGELF